MSDDEVFDYTGEGGAVAPRDVVRVRVDSSITSIPVFAFKARKKLAEVELCEGLVEIGEDSFCSCNHSIRKIIIPNSLRRINDTAFCCSLRTPIRLNDGIESIGRGAFAACIFTNFRVPTLITVIPDQMLYSCRSIFSLELPHNTTKIENGAFHNCVCLRNVAFPPNAIGDDIFIEDEEYILSDLQRLFGNSNERIMRELQHRFDGLLIHSIVYYQSYHHGVLQILIAAINMRSSQRRSLRSKLDPTGNQQDCLGMTPLHIMTCSSVHDIEVHRLIVENYPTNLITEDRWGALPLLYAFWGAAPDEIIQFLLNSYQLYYPDHVFNWTMIVETIGRCDTPKESIENLLCIKQMHYPEQPLDWNHLLDGFMRPSSLSVSGSPLQERMQFLVMCGMTLLVEALPFKVWRDHITSMIYTASFLYNKDNLGVLHEIRSKVAHFEDKYSRLKEITTILELALWKMKMNEERHHDRATQGQKKIKNDDSNIRSHNRITCGADVVIGHVLLFLINTG